MCTLTDGKVRISILTPHCRTACSQERLQHSFCRQIFSHGEGLEFSSDNLNFERSTGPLALIQTFSLD